MILHKKNLIRRILMKVVLFGEKGKFNRLLLIDGVLGLSDK